ncbi:MAG: phosphoribosyltransferase [Candidatus Bathyarchaeia archaeon]
MIELADEIKKNGFKPDIIVGVARGGWPPARILSDFLNNPNIANIKVEFYMDVYKTVEAPVITQPISVPVDGKRILVVDDVADSGKSLKMVRETLLENGATDVKIATIYYKPWSIVKPDFYAKTTEAWIIFPWERYETIKKLGEKLKNEGKTLSEIEAELIKIGLQPIIVKRFVKEIFGEK